MIWNALTPKRRRQLLGLQILSILAALGEVANIGALLPFLRLLANPFDGINSLGPLAQPLRGLSGNYLLLALGLGFMLVVTISTTLRLLAIIIQLRLTALITTDIGDKVYSVILSKPYSWHLKTNSSEILTFLTKDVDTVFGSLQAFMTFAMNASIVLLLGGYLIALSPVVMLFVATLLTSFYLLVYRLTSASIKYDGARQLLEYQYSVQLAQEAIGNIRDVILDSSQAFFLNAYTKRNRSGRLAGASLNTKAQVPRYLIEGFVMFLIIGVSICLAFTGKGIETQIPLLGTLVLGAYRLLQPLQQCFTSVSTLSSSQASFKRLGPFLENNISNKTYFLEPININTETQYSSRTFIEFDQVSFSYNSSSKPVLSKLDFKINKGQRIALVGSTGSGKSTTSDLILGLLAPTEGNIIVNGNNLHSTKNLLSQWQSQVAHVPQHIFLSDSSFASNIAVGLPRDQIDYESVYIAAKQARISDMIETSAEGYETVVGERGVSLSGGQRQRIGIARALYKKAKLLVLDEATSALDNQTEAEVMEAIESLDHDLTVIIIAHRLSTVRNCDVIYILNQGRIDGYGTYNDLVASNHDFRAMVQHNNSNDNLS